MARRRQRKARGEAHSSSKSSQDEAPEPSSHQAAAGNRTPRNDHAQLTALSKVAFDKEPVNGGSSEIVCQVFKLSGELCTETFLTKDSNVSDIKDAIEQKTHIPPERQKLLFDQLELSANMRVPTIKDSRTLSLCLAILSEPSWRQRPSPFPRGNCSTDSGVHLSTKSFDKGVHRLTMQLAHRDLSKLQWLDMLGICEANANAHMDPSGGPGFAAWCATTPSPYCRLQVRQQGKKAKDRTVSQEQVRLDTVGSVVEITLDCHKRRVSFRVADLTCRMTELGVVENLPDHAYRFFLTLGSEYVEWFDLSFETLNV
jgi:hypothetical protein